MECRVLKTNKCEITNSYGNGHNGVDIVGGGYTLDYIVAHSDGKVIFCQDGLGNMKGSSGNASYGNCVKIDHGNEYATLYAHMKKGLSVKNGQSIKKGQVLGYMSDSGRAFGSHLHFEVWKNGIRINPTDYLNKPLYEETKKVDKSIEELANEVIQGKYGNGEDRKKALGDRYSEVQKRVNEILAPKTSVDILDLVRRTIRGDFGNGQARKDKLGSNYSEVQRQVNANYNHGTTSWNNIRLY